MVHALVDNATRYAFDAHFLMDEAGRPLAVALLKASFELPAGREPVLAEEQARIEPGGMRWFGPESSFKLEPECTTFMKPATDVALVGHVESPHAGAARVEVTLRVGALEKRLLVQGMRNWVRSPEGVRPSTPQPFERVPLAWEHALGGWDCSDPDPAKHALEARNPLGVGFRAPSAPFVDGPLPNIEDPADPLTRYGQEPAPEPSCVGFVGPSFETRARFAGHYDEAWRAERMPLLPADFDRRFFNAAAPGLVADGHLRGGEEVLVEGVRADGALHFTLPRLPLPRCRMGIRRRPDADVQMALDTVVIDSDARRLYLSWRGHLILGESAHDLRWIALR